MKRLSYAEIAQELGDFLDVQGEKQLDEEESDYYYYQRGAIDFLQHLKAACSEPLPL